MTKVNYKVGAHNYTFRQVFKGHEFDETTTVLMYAKNNGKNYEVMEVEVVSNPNKHINTNPRPTYFEDCDSIFIVEHSIQISDRKKSDNNLYPISILFRGLLRNKSVIINSLGELEFAEAT